MAITVVSSLVTGSKDSGEDASSSILGCRLMMRSFTLHIPLPSFGTGGLKTKQLVFHYRLNLSCVSPKHRFHTHMKHG